MQSVHQAAIGEDRIPLAPSMARRQSASKATPQTATTPSAIPTPIPRPANPPPPTSKLKISPLLEVYEATISSLIGTLSEDPFRQDSISDFAQRLIQCEQELEEALEEVKQHHENTRKIQQLQQQNAELSKLFSSNLNSLSEARTLLSSLPDSRPATIDNKIPYQQILEYASKISNYTSPPPHWDPSRPQQPGSYVPWPSEDAIRRGRLAQLALEGISEPPIEEEKPQETEIEETKGPRRNPGRRATSVEARRRKMSEGGEPRPIREREKDREIEFELDLFNPDEDT